MARAKPADTPLMRQFLEIKEQHPDAILFFRLGDFYEMFFEDAVIAAGALDLVLTSRDKGRDDGVPMCGVPHHAARGYIAKLLEQGHRVVLAEQTEDPKKAKGLVRREVVQIITPGVVLDDEVLDPKIGRYLAAVAPAPGRAQRYGFAYLDASTGEFAATEVDGLDALVGEVVRVGPRELLAADTDLAPDGKLAALRKLVPRCAYTAIQPTEARDVDAALDRAVADDARGAALGGMPLAARAAADAVLYARATQPTGTLPMSRPRVYRPGEAVVLDEAAVANLELVQTLMGGRKDGSLLGVIDRTRTAPGGRLLRRWLLYPLTQVAPIRRRQDAVEYFVDRPSTREKVRDALATIGDLERLAGKVSLRVATPRDLGVLRDSLQALPGLIEHIADGGGLELPELLGYRPPAVLGELAAELRAALVDEPPAMGKDGGYVRDGFCPIVDEHRALADGGKDAVAAIERRERERSGIPTLKVKYNRVFGYYLEVTRSHLDKVPADYVRKQTIANGERYVTPELADLEQKIVSAQDALILREGEIFAELCGRIARFTDDVVEAGRRVAAIDCVAGLADLAHNADYTRPVVDDSAVLDIVDGRHPVVETTVPRGAFVPNDCRLDPDAEQILLVTGPNMAGKSTYMRQVAHIVLLAQMGAFVPARSARVGVVDRVFTRVGAADNLARGESTFMVEMRETAAILAGATARSLVVLDEVGRGTSTFDGVSIAWAVTEHLHDRIGCRTLFATHYHELCALAESRPRLRNVSVAVKEHGGEIVFLRRVVDGGASRSYGIDVARLAGLPRGVVARARAILAQLEGGQALGASGTAQLALFAAAPAPAPAPAPDDELVEAVRSADLNALTPLEALNFLAKLQAIVGG